MQSAPNFPFAGHPFMARLSRLATLSAADLASFERIVGDERLVKKRGDLVIVGHEYRNLCFVRDGYAIRYKLLRSGKRQILNVILPGDVIGFPVSFFDRSLYSVVAVSDLAYNVCSLEAYVRLCHEQPQFGLVLSWLAAHEAAIYAEHIVDLGRRTPGRTARALPAGDSCAIVERGSRGSGKLQPAVFPGSHGRRAGLERPAS